MHTLKVLVGDPSHTRLMNPSSPIGAVVGGRYELVRKLGQGGMGEVYEARRTDLGDRVAVKLLRDEDHDDHEMRARFLREARTLAQVTSPHVVRIVDFSANAGEVAFLAMEYLEGQNASEIVRMRGPFSAREVLPLVKQLCAGVGALHALGLVHRDIKPQNTMIVDGGPLGPIVKLVDFGLAKSTIASESPLTDHLTVLGTPSYMAPEQVGANTTIDTRADVYGTAATFVAMATGKTLYAEEGVAIVAAILAGKRLSVHRVAPELGPTLCATLERALSGDRTLRHATIEQLAADIERGLLALGSTAHATLAGNVSFAQHTLLHEASRVAPAIGAEPSARPESPSSTMPRSQRSGTAPLAITTAPHVPAAPGFTASAFEPSDPRGPNTGQVGQFPFAGTSASPFQPAHLPTNPSHHAIGTYPPPSPRGPGAGPLSPFSGTHKPIASDGSNTRPPHVYVGAPVHSGARHTSANGALLLVALALAGVGVLGVAAVVVALFLTRPLGAARPAPAVTTTSTAVLTSAETPSPPLSTAPPPPRPIRCTEGPARCAALCSKLGAPWKTCAGGCANTDDDPSHCGTCGHKCADAPECQSPRACTCRAGRCLRTKP